MFPVVILVRPQLGENIGMAARAMLNCGATQLRIVAPRDGWPSETALSASAGAANVVQQATVFDSVHDAVADLNNVMAATARPRQLEIPVIAPEAAPNLATAKTGILFGPENNGLNNDDLAMVNQIITVPLNPVYTSLNLSQSVLLVLYQFWQQQTTALAPKNNATTNLAAKKDITVLADNLGNYLTQANYFHPPEKAASMQRNLSVLLNNANLSTQQVQTLQGVFRALWQTKV